MNIVLQILVSSVAIYFAAWLLPGISVKNYGAAILVAIVLGFLDTFLKPFLQFISFPITVLTLGLFLLVINTLLILLASWLLGSNFHVQNFWWALLFSIIVSIIQSILAVLVV